MRGRSFVAVIAVGLALVFGELVPVAVAAEDAATAGQPAAASPAAIPQPNAALSSSNAAASSPSAPSAPGATTPPQSTEAAPVAPADPVVAGIRSKLGDAALRKGADAKDLATLEAFYAARNGPPVWITPMGLSAKGQAVVNEIGKADDWGLSAAAFELPPKRYHQPIPHAWVGDSDL
jgi:hypothetical protein